MQYDESHEREYFKKYTFPTNLNTIKMFNEIKIEKIYLHHGVGGLGGEEGRVCLMAKLGVRCGGHVL